MQDEPKRPRLPSYDLDKIMKTRIALARTVGPMAGMTMSGAELDNVVDVIMTCLSDQTPREAVKTSLASVAGLPLTIAAVAELSWRLAGNAGKLHNGLTVPPWSAQKEPEWCPLQVESVDPIYIEKLQSEGGDVRFRILAGSPSGKFAHRSWSIRLIRRLKSEFGFGRKNEPPEWAERRGQQVISHFPFRHSTELTRLRIWGLITPEHSKPGEPGFE